MQAVSFEVSDQVLGTTKGKHCLPGLLTDLHVFGHPLSVPIRRCFVGEVHCLFLFSGPSKFICFGLFRVRYNVNLAANLVNLVNTSWPRACVQWQVSYLPGPERFKSLLALAQAVMQTAPQRVDTGSLATGRQSFSRLWAVGTDLRSRRTGLQSKPDWQLLRGPNAPRQLQVSGAAAAVVKDMLYPALAGYDKLQMPRRPLWLHECLTTHVVKFPALR